MLLNITVVDGRDNSVVTFNVDPEDKSWKRVIQPFDVRSGEPRWTVEIVRMPE